MEYINWFGLKAVSLSESHDMSVCMVFLPLHDHGFCGTAVRSGSKWTLFPSIRIPTEIERAEPGNNIDPVTVRDKKQETFQILHELRHSHGVQIDIPDFIETEVTPQIQVPGEAGDEALIVKMTPPACPGVLKQLLNVKLGS